MNKFKLVLLLQFVCLQVSAQSSNFCIKGKFEANNGTTIFLKYTKNGKNILDSTKLKDNLYSFKGSVDEPSQAYVTDQVNIIQFMPFFMLCNGDKLDIDLMKNDFEKQKF